MTVYVAGRYLLVMLVLVLGERWLAKFMGAWHAPIVWSLTINFPSPILFPWSPSHFALNALFYQSSYTVQ